VNQKTRRVGMCDQYVIVDPGGSTVWGSSMNAYAPLQRYLSTQADEQVTLTFSEVADLIGKALPTAAQHASWWSNDPKRPEAKSWLDAGYHSAFLDSTAGSVTFIRVFATMP
jgi:hypothetical protein